MIRNLTAFLILLSVKICSRLCYRFRHRWLKPAHSADWKELRMILVLHHTSLYEVIYFGLIPVSVLWSLAKRGVAPVASVTLSRPFIGKAFRMMSKNTMSLSRKRDHTWDALLERIEPDSLVLLVPEGRMMRRNGLDKHGRPMTVRGGIADVLQRLGSGKIMMIYSGGMHHIQVPGEHQLPKLGKKVYCRCEMLDVDSYREEFADAEDFKAAVIQDLERRRDRHCPPTGFPPEEQNPTQEPSSSEPGTKRRS